jgi:hypothetical protein
VLGADDDSAVVSRAGSKGVRHHKVEVGRVRGIEDQCRSEKRRLAASALHAFLARSGADHAAPCGYPDVQGSGRGAIQSEAGLQYPGRTAEWS